MTVRYTSPLADAKDFTAPDIFVLPRDRRNFSTKGVSLSRFEAHRFIYTQARGALFHLSKVLNSKTVWLPAYHCPALVEPFSVSGKKINFYPVTAELQPNFEFLKDHVKQRDAVVAIRYFGFDCGIAQLSELCKQLGFSLIEDLAHSPFVERLFGEFAVTSLWKFYPVDSGAELCIPIDSKYRSDFVSLYKKLPDRPIEWLSKLSKRLSVLVGKDVDIPYSAFFDLRDISKNLKLRDSFTLKSAAAGAIAETRRSNFKFLASRLNVSPMGKSLFDELPNRVIPYVFPFLLDDASLFSRIRNRGIQIYRWEQIAVSECRVSNTYRSRLIQLPCHQQLTNEDLSRIVAAMKI